MTCQERIKYLKEIFAILGADTAEIPELFAVDSPTEMSASTERRSLLRLTRFLANKTRNQLFPLSEVIEEFCDVPILPFEQMSVQTKEKIELAVTLAQQEIKENPLHTARPNEAGVLFEKVLEKKLLELGFQKQTGEVNTKMGYPDLQVLLPETNETAYIECKTHDQTTANSSLRTFYLTPSLVKKKVTRAGYHVLCALTLERTIHNQENAYQATAAAPVVKDLSDLKVKIKYEYNAGNKDMYGESE